METASWLRALTWTPGILIGIFAFLSRPSPSRAHYLQWALASTLNALIQLNLSPAMFYSLWMGWGVLSLILALWESYHRHGQLPSRTTLMVITAVWLEFGLLIFLEQKWIGHH